MALYGRKVLLGTPKAKASGPIGWLVGGAWFVSNLIYANYHDGKSITEDLLDN